jgi:hypothetical protein
MKGALLFGVALGLVAFVAMQGMAVSDVSLPWAIAAIVGSRLAADIVGGILVVYLLRIVLEAGHLVLGQARVSVSSVLATRRMPPDGADGSRES